MAPHLDIHDRGTVGVQTVLAFVTAVATHAARSRGDRRGQIETHLGTVTHRVFLVAYLQLVANGHIGSLEHRGVVLAAIEEKRSVVSMIGIRVLQPRELGIARQHHVARQIAAGDVEPQPSVIVPYGQTVGCAFVQKLDIIFARRLEIIQQIGTVDLHPRLQRDLLHLIETHLRRLDARNGNQGRRHGRHAE